VLSARMGVLSNGEELSLARRNKYLMGEQVRKSTRAVQQKMATTWEDIELFLQEWNPNPLQVRVTVKCETVMFATVMCETLVKYRSCAVLQYCTISTCVKLLSRTACSPLTGCIHQPLDDTSLYLQ
jgi:hypothetical protein